MMAPEPTDRRRPSAAALRVLAFGAASVLLIGIALIAGGVGPWTARPIDSSPPRYTPPPQEISPISLPSMDAGPRNSEPVALAWGVRLVFFIVIGLVVLAIVWYLLQKVLSMRSGRNAGLHGQRLEAVGTAPPPPPPVEGESGRNFDPRAAADAIISCWLWVENAAEAGVFARQQQDTPTEFLQRFVEHTAVEDTAVEHTAVEHTAVEDDSDTRDGAVDPKMAAESSSSRVDDAATVLLPLYQRARFDHVALTPDAAVQARQAAQVLCEVAGSRSAARAAGAGDLADDVPAGATGSAAGPAAGRRGSGS